MRGRAAARSRPRLPPEKLQKVLAQAGVASRREIEEMIAAGRIRVNGVPAHIGQRVGALDRVKVNGRLVALRAAPARVRVLLYHKPEGEIVSRDDPQGRASVFAHLPRPGRGRWVAVGRLDYNSSGLLLLTTSGELANRLMHPRYGVEREYAVRVIGELGPERFAQLREGVKLEDGMARFDTLEEAGGSGTNRWYRVRLAEGRNREVRRMFDAVGVKVSRLIRTRYGPVAMPHVLRRGGWRELSEKEVGELMAALKEPSPAAPRSAAPERAAGKPKPVVPKASAGKLPRKRRFSPAD
ncbi:MAG: 23S rRNA pseudouridylate synthase B [Betaproteobacteria bacterium CG2_30_68_42]|nr:MAG: 23S rRNA pseudouridylate synthase B [Betaproteobacteria bacterium CG2_30_68_42]